MIQLLAKKLSNFLIESGLPSENIEIYSYGAECFLNLLICNSLLLFFGFSTHHLIEILLWIISFSCLRHHIGGYHANSHISCISLSVLLGILSITINTIFETQPILIYIPIIFCIFCIAKLAPVLHLNHPITDVQKRKAHTNAIITLLVELISFFFLYLNQLTIAYSIITGIFTASLCCLMGHIKNRKETIMF